MGRTMGLSRSLAVTISAFALGLGAATGSAQAQRGEMTVTCKNVSSGASFEILIDYEHATVDSNPARISDAQITWKDLKDGWNYTLDRKSGNLTVILASATGGNFLYDHCKLEK